jgi:tryptophan-rich sensory protein
MKTVARVILAIVVCELVGVAGSLFTTPAIDSWYAFLAKPAFSPPSWLFAPAWTLLYALMGVAIALVWPRLSKLFVLQLLVNGLWSFLFFGLHNPLLGLIDIVVLWILILVLLLGYWRINKTSFWLFVPYFLWVSFATALNFSVWRLNG